MERRPLTGLPVKDLLQRDNLSHAFYREKNLIRSSVGRRPLSGLLLRKYLDQVFCRENTFNWSFVESRPFTDLL